mgnify:CR=1 FL=1
MSRWVHLGHFFFGRPKRNCLRGALEINSQDLVVHAMDDKSADDVTSQRLEQQIAGLFVGKGME